MRLRDYTPRGYNARNVLILVVPMLIFMLAMTLYFFNSHVQDVNTKLSRGVAQELAVLVDTAERHPDNWPSLVHSYARAGMMGVTLTVMKLDDELKECVDYPADSMGLKQL